MQIIETGSQHWVGDGFPVRNLFPSTELGFSLDPFLMLDYAGPHAFAPAGQARGVGEHPHRGFETVTLLYQGEVAHRDSGGNAGRLGPGDVQWMTAASGVVHEEMHSEEFTRRGGMFEAVQLWVNLPRAHKMDAPGYQTLVDGTIPRVAEAGTVVRVIAGEWAGVKGPARTFTPVDVWDVGMEAGGRWEWRPAAGRTAALVLLEGEVVVNGEKVSGGAKVVVDASYTVEAVAASRLLALGGEPLREPIATYGPFVMNTREEIVQAMEDYRAGRMGRL